MQSIQSDYDKAKAEYTRKMDEGRYAGTPALAESPISSEMNRLREEVERALKLSYTLADRLQSVMSQPNTGTANAPSVPTSVPDVPMVGHIEGLRRTVSEGANLLVGILDRLAL